MKVLAESNLNYNIAHNLIPNLRKVGNVGVANDITNIAKALNDFQPNIVILKEENITNVVKVYCKKNNVKIISFGESENKDADITFLTSADIPRANLEVLEYKNHADKTDISVFVNHEGQKLFAEFLCKNYNVKVYGNIKINSPRYLGHISITEKYEILNKSKISIAFNGLDFYDSVLLDSYPIVFNTERSNMFSSFNNLISLSKCLDDVINNNITYDINSLKNNIKHDNSLIFTINILQQLGFKQQALKLNEILEEIVI